MAMSKEEQYNFILQFVKEYRNLMNIIPTPGYKSEGSGEMYGEGYMLLFRQLVYTTDGMDGWLEINDAQIRELVVKEIEKYYAAKAK
jgi:hypothetical protein